MSQELKPCPFCGAGKTDIHFNGRMWTGQRLSEPISVSIRHWCEDVPGQPHRMIERVGRDEVSAIAAWNSRAAAPPGWVLVPEEPTQVMLDAMQSGGWMPGNYRAMLAAAPDAPQSHPQR